jgi:hypothetical protein
VGVGDWQVTPWGIQVISQADDKQCMDHACSANSSEIQQQRKVS